MAEKKESFSELLKQFEYHYDLRTTFDDFLTMATCAFGQNSKEGKSYDEDLYLQTMEKYKNSDLRHNFPKLVTKLSFEMEERLESSEGFDVLGEFYEANLARKGASQFLWIENKKRSRNRLRQSMYRLTNRSRLIVNL